MSRSLPLLALSLLVLLGHRAHAQDPVPNTVPWDLEGDPADVLVAGVDRFLLRQTAEVSSVRDQRWTQWGQTTPDAAKRREAMRQRLRDILGMRDPLTAKPKLEMIRPVGARESAPVAGATKINAVRWEVLTDVWMEGLMIEPAQGTIEHSAIVLPDADQPPETLAGLVADDRFPQPLGLQLAANGYRVLIPTLVNRTVRKVGNVELTNREYLYRAAFGLGRTLQGFEVQAVIAGCQSLLDAQGESIPIDLAGYGEGGRIALYAAALEPRFHRVLISGAFGPREAMWQEPIDRNLFGVLNDFGDAELASIIAPRTLIIETSEGPKYTVQGRGAGPGSLPEISPEAARTEFDRIAARVQTWNESNQSKLIASEPGRAFSAAAVEAWTASKLKPNTSTKGESQPPDTDAITARQERMIRLWDRWTQAVLEESPYVRAEFMKQLDTRTPEAYASTSEAYRQVFSRDVIGEFDLPLAQPRPRIRKAYDTPTWQGYEVALDVWPDVIAYGVLLLPRDLAEGERRPVVVCQHGLEGRPQDIITGDHPAYHDFAAKLCEKGYIVFAPQNLYLFTDRFRTLQRKSNPLGKLLFSIIAPQHRQIVHWLASLPYVDGHRIAFYGLSYGGKSAMRIPALVPEYCLSICSADFNDWVWKLASTRSPYSYVRTPEYEIFEYNLGGTFNYSEMASLIAPRPFMVERGHFDGVAPDERVALEFAKVRHLYSAKLGLTDRAEIEWFVGPHTINGKATFDFLDRHLKKPKE